MKSFFKVAIFVTFIVVACTMNAYAWGVTYDANTNQLPTGVSPAWTSVILGSNTATVSNGLLRIQHITGSSYYYREAWAIDAGIPVTMEAKMRVDASSIGAPQLSIQTKGCHASLNVYSDHLQAYDWPSKSNVVFYENFTVLQTVRMAYDGENNVYAWVNNQLALSWTLSGGAGQNGISFGTYNSADVFDSYWQYVSYSKQFLPVPEPSSLLGVSSLLFTLAGFAIRRRSVRG